MKFLIGGVRFLFVTVGIIVLTSFTIDATDSFRTSQTAFSLFAQKTVVADCPVGTVQIDLAQQSICIDRFENGVGDACGVKDPSLALETAANISMENCMPVSVAGTKPWTHVSYHQAKTLCALKNMRLPTPQEWYEASLGTPETGCNTDSSIAMTGAYTTCVSARGVHDMIGNVWEWVEGEVVDGALGARIIPESGYVQEVAADGIVVETGNLPEPLYGNDYHWSTREGIFGIMRGGFHGSEEDAGIYATHANVAPSFAGTATGFRCVKSL